MKHFILEQYNNVMGCWMHLPVSVDGIGHGISETQESTVSVEPKTEKAHKQSGLCEIGNWTYGCSASTSFLSYKKVKL